MPSDAEIVSIRRAAGLSSRAETESLVSALNADELNTALELAERWTELDSDFVVVDEKVKLDPQTERDAIRRDLRNLLGLSVFSEEDRGADYLESFAVRVETW